MATALLIRRPGRWDLLLCPPFTGKPLTPALSREGPGSCWLAPASPKQPKRKGRRPEVLKSLFPPPRQDQGGSHLQATRSVINVCLRRFLESPERPSLRFGDSGKVVAKTPVSRKLAVGKVENAPLRRAPEGPPILLETGVGSV